MPTTAPAAPRPAAPRSRTTPASRAPAPTPSAPRRELAAPSPRAPALPAFARSAWTPQSPASSAATPSFADKKAAPKPRDKLAPLAPPGGSKASGKPLAPHIQEAIEHSLQVDLGPVRLHSDAAAQETARSLAARAFAFGHDIYLGKGEHESDLGLLAHEAAHVVQQKGGAVIQKFSADRGDPFEREADRASSAVQRGESFAVRERVAAPRVQRFPGIGRILDYLADKAYNIPGYRMFTVLLGVNPINMESIERSAANVFRAVVEFIPGGKLITDALEQYKVFDRVADRVHQQIDSLGITLGLITHAFSEFIDSLGISDVAHPGDVWDRAKRIFSEPIDRIKNFVVSLLEGIWKFVREALLLPLAGLAEKTAGWDLLIAVLGTNPITGETVPRNPDTIIGGFMKLIHEEEIWNNIKRANALSRVAAWFKGGLSELLGFVTQIPSLFKQALKSLEWTDIILIPRAFMKIAGVFGKFLGSFMSWAGAKVWDLLLIIFEVVAPAVIPYLKKVGAAFKTILKNPIGFVRNLVAAGKLGFEHFVAKIGMHLKASFLEWLTGSMPGVYIPKALELQEIIKFVLSVLGLTWANIRAKLVKATSESAVKAMETGVDIVVTLVKEGPAAAWEKIKDEIGNLKEMVMQSVIGYITETLVKKAVAKVVSLLVPGGAFIQAIITIYDTIMVFVAKLVKIIEVTKAFLDSMMEIAAGAIGSAADKVENALAGLLTLAISFLAGFAGLGKVADKVMEIINTKIRQPIDKALDKVVGWIVTLAKKGFATAKSAVTGWWKNKVPFQTESGESHEVYFSGDEQHAVPMVASRDPQPIESKLSEFSKRLSGKGVSKAQEKAGDLIAPTRALVKKDLSDPKVFAKVADNMKVLFNAFEPAGTWNVKDIKTDLKKPVTMELGGSTVGVHMIIDWLDSRFNQTHPGSTPRSGQQDVLMNKLVTDPGNDSPDKFIRGHLLNHNLGGEGVADNMFPITGKANRQHLDSTERTVKSWVPELKGDEKPTQWVRYEVKVDLGDKHLDPVDEKLSKKARDKIRKQNYVNSTFTCGAVLKNAKGEELNRFNTVVQSTYQAGDQEASRVDFP